MSHENLINILMKGFFVSLSYHIMSSCLRGRARWKYWQEGIEFWQDEVVVPFSKMIHVRLCRRRPCTPACPKSRPFCAGRCWYGGKACFFHPCMTMPWRSQMTKCSEMAYKTTKKKCKKACTTVDTPKGSKVCQKCLVKQLPGSCKKEKGSGCWHCIGPLVKDLRDCHKKFEESSSVENCFNKKPANPQCATCKCTLLCSIMDPEASLCENCEKNLS